MIRVGDYVYKRVANRHSESDREAKQYLRRLDILNAEGNISSTRREEVWIGLAIDEYNNQATLVVDQGRSPDLALSEARDLLRDYWMAYDEEFSDADIKDMVFGPFDPSTAANIIRSLPRSVAVQIRIYE